MSARNSLILKLFISILPLILFGLFHTNKSQRTRITSHIYGGCFRKGPDYPIFLDPYVLPLLKDLNKKTMLDLGCGPYPYGIYAAQHGAFVTACVIQPKIIELAEVSVKEAGVADRVKLELADACALTYPDEQFDLVLSVNTACYLPSTMKIVLFNDKVKMIGIGPHLKEIYRVLKTRGQAIVAVPASLGTVFTNGQDPKEVQSRITAALQQIGSSENITVIKTHLKETQGVYRATFVHRDNQLVLVTDEKTLIPGETIWRKVPDYAITHRYHSEEEYAEAVLDAGFKIQKIEKPHFANHKTRRSYNEGRDLASQFGREYTTSYPFLIFFLTRE